MQLMRMRTMLRLRICLNMIKADKEADVTWRMIILRSRQMVLLRGVMTTEIILPSRSMLRRYLKMIKADKRGQSNLNMLLMMKLM